MRTPFELAELWRLALRGDAVRCVASTHPLGVELRYEMNDHPLMSRVFDDWDALSRQAREWRDSLESRGWVSLGVPAHS